MALYSQQKYLGVSQAGFALNADILNNLDRVINSSATPTGVDGATVNIFLRTIDAGTATATYSALAGYTGGDANGG